MHKPKGEKIPERLTTAEVMAGNRSNAAEVPVLFPPADNIAHGAAQQLLLAQRTVPHLEVVQAANEAVAHSYNKAILSFMQVTQHQASIGLQALRAVYVFPIHQITITVDFQQLFPGVPQAAHTIPCEKG